MTINLFPSRALEIANKLNQAIKLQNNGHSQQAQKIYEEVLKISPNNFDALRLLGGLLAESMLFKDALKLLNKAIKINGKDAFLFNNLANVYAEVEEYSSAILNYNKAINLKPEFFTAYCNRSIALTQLGQLESALISCNKAIELKADYYEAHHNKGIILEKLNRLPEAIKSYNESISLAPNYSQAYINLGNTYLLIGKYDDSLACYRKALFVDPSNADIFHNLGNTYLEMKQFKEALSSYDKAIDINPYFVDAYLNRGNVLQRLRLLEESLISYNKALEINPKFAQAYSNKATALQELRELDEALINFNKSIEIDPSYPTAYFSKALLLLLSGQFEKGLDLYEWRWKDPSTGQAMRNFIEPVWLGVENIAGKTILLYAEQGLGDTLQFCRYAKLVDELGAKVLLEVQKPLVHLLHSLGDGIEIFENGSQLPDFDFQCPILSLPLALNTTIESIPRSIPYINIDISRQNLWRDCLGNSGFKIAICWQGSTQGKVDIGRSFPVSLFEGIAKINGVRLISLQKNEGIEQLKSLPSGMKVELLPDDFDSGDNAFLDSAAVLKCVDLVITSDTVLTHLSGALGVKTWLPLQYVPDWRWMLDRSDSPWYPNHRLFRQKTRGDWTGVFKEMENELKAMVSTKHNKSI
jgi:tetratricopeptide (TPR) repeat protein